MTKIERAGLQTIVRLVDSLMRHTSWPDEVEVASRWIERQIAIDAARRHRRGKYRRRRA